MNRSLSRAKSPMTSTSRILPRERITAALNSALLEFPLVVLSAPMGYGKTTAVRELVAMVRDSMFYVGIPPGLHSAVYLWDVLFEQLMAQGLKIAKPLRNMGFPADILHRQRVFTLCLSCPRPVLLVLDDYHFVDDSEVDAFIEALVRANLPGFHVLLLSRTRPNLPLQEMQMKGLAAFFGQELLTFSPEESLAYFRLHDSHNEKAAQRAWEFSEGWAAALWLSLQRWQTHGVIAPVSDVETLLSETVFSAYSLADQTLLLKLSILDRFTLGQAVAVSNDLEAPRRLRSLLNKNAFLTTIPSSDSYQLHSIFRCFLAHRLAELRDHSAETLTTINKPALYARAAEWFVEHNDLVRAIHFFARAGRDEDKLRILDLFLLPTSGLIVFFDSEGIPPILKNIPWRVRQLCPLGWLAFIHQYTTRMPFADGIALLRDSALQFSQNEIIAPELKQRIKGEIALINGVIAFNDLGAMRDCYAKAYALLHGQRSVISYPRQIWTLSCPQVSFLYLQQPGSYAELVRLVEKDIHHYQELTGGCSIGAQELFRAELLLETGQKPAVEQLLMKATYKALAKEQFASLIAINFCLARLHLALGRKTEALTSLRDLAPLIAKIGNPMLDIALDIAQGHIAILCGEKEAGAVWLRVGDELRSRALYQGANFARITYGKALLAAEEWPRLEVFAEDIPAQLGAYNNLFGHIHANVLLSIATLHLHGTKRALPFLLDAIKLARPDGILCSLAEYGASITPLLALLKHDVPEDAFIKALYTAAKRYGALSRHAALGDDSLLTPQEKIIFKKLKHGLSNSQIADCLGIARKTVANSLSRVYAKLGVSTRAEAVVRIQP